MGRIAVVTDSASDLSPDRAAAAGIVVVPLIVSFGSETFRAGTELPTPAFWQRMLAPEAPFPTTAACSPGDFRDAYEQCFAEGAEAIISIHVAHTPDEYVEVSELRAAVDSYQRLVRSLLDA